MQRSELLQPAEENMKILMATPWWGYIFLIKSTNLWDLSFSSYQINKYADPFQEWKVIEYIVLEWLYGGNSLALAKQYLWWGSSVFKAETLLNCKLFFFLAGSRSTWHGHPACLLNLLSKRSVPDQRDIVLSLQNHLEWGLKYRFPSQP